MQKTLLLVLFLTAAASAQDLRISEWERAMGGTHPMQGESLPQPDSRGEYQRSDLHPFFQVMVEELNGRRPSSILRFDESAPVVTQFRRGMILVACPPPDTQTGMCIFRDTKDQAWMRITTGPGPDDWCLVRAHRKYLRPVRITEK